MPSPDRMTHDWQPLPAADGCATKGKWEHVPGKPVCLVRTEPTPQGFLWQHGKQYGFGKTLAEAKEWAEAAREFWPRHLPG
ncbi:hypothetical protein HU675_0038560 [Bradyrhizobium septentrionale]|uniref:hypothetical protein n=1 Tax=Bradyrhizobium septentrionale TaxID=1404411 RepID=UPI00159668AE|nr:hypothetical protein [Bradyrhizobium septentrionale]UGY23789.1 hypothetical protein HU675_0038560 [Bradyrhizobium septentrionale]